MISSSNNGGFEAGWRTLSGFDAGVKEVAEYLGTDLERGLTADQASERLQRHGPNRLTRQRAVTFAGVLQEEVLEEPLILFLILVGVLYAWWGSIGDAITIFAIIALLILVEVVNEFRAKRAISALRDLSSPTAQVIRAGSTFTLQAEDLVPGDIVLLAAGSRIPADLRLIESTALNADESMLTGESLPVIKDPYVTLPVATPLMDRHNMAYAGTVIPRGRGRGVVVATGMDTELGKITGLAEQVKEPKTPLQRTMRELARKLTFVAVAVSLLVPAVGVLLGQPLREMLLTGLTLAFATVPEELPILITMVLAMGAYRLSRDSGVIVKRLNSAETIGSISVLLSDKTGTLTENKMRVAVIRPLDTSIGEDQLLYMAGLCTDVILTPDHASGDAIDVALMEENMRRGLMKIENGEGRAEILLPFDDTLRLMAAVTPSNTLIVKGAPEAILTLCTKTPEEIKEKALKSTLDLAQGGQRVLAVAAGGARPEEPNELPDDLSLIGLISFADPPRTGAREAIEALRAAGIRTVMVTGDHPDTARWVAREVGIPNARPFTMDSLDEDKSSSENRRISQEGGSETSESLPDLDEAKLGEAIRHTDVFARVTPAGKLGLVEAFNRTGVTAVTGDGINDAPALRAANAGIAMGKNGTDVAREAAGLILTNDDLSSLVRAVREGRLLFANLSGAVRYYLAVKVALILTAFIPVLLGGSVPFTPVQIILLELFMDLGASLTFVAERGGANLLRSPPRDPSRPFLNNRMLLMIAGGGILLSTVVLTAYFWALGGGASVEQARTAAFVAWLVAHVALAAGFRQSLSLSRMLLLWAAGAVGLATASAALPFVRIWLQTSPLTWMEAAAIAVASILTFLLSYALRRAVSPNQH